MFFHAPYSLSVYSDRFQAGSPLDEVESISACYTLFLKRALDRNPGGDSESFSNDNTPANEKHLGTGKYYSRPIEHRRRRRRRRRRNAGILFDHIHNFIDK